MPTASAAPMVILTGAGISAESGLATFRGAGGLWDGHPVEQVATPEGFQRDPARVHRFYNERRAQLGSVQPNRAHVALAELEHAWPGDFLLVTQNVDDLHERAGSRKLVHMHGELNKARCRRCGRVFPWSGPTGEDSQCPSCGRAPSLRPHIVWFGEIPLEMDRIGSALERCGVFLAIGTSGNVYPAAGFVALVPPSARTLEVNLEPSLVADAFRERRIGKAGECVPVLVRELLAGLRG